MRLCYKFIIILFLLSCNAYSQDARIPKINLQGPINSVLSDIVVSDMNQASVENAPFILIEVDTPGGFDEAMRNIIEKILNSPIPVVVYVSPGGARAASAGFFILLSADVAVMAPGTNTGAAHPVFSIGGVVPIDGEKGGAKTLTEKVENDAKAYLRGIVTERGRDPELAELGITESKSYTAEEALEGNLIDFIANNEKDLIEKLKGREVKLFDGTVVQLPEKISGFRTRELHWRQKLMLAVSNPNLALILGLIGVLLIYMEISHPGLIVPGVLGAIFFLLALIGFSLLPINYVGVLLILLAMGLFIAEIMVQGFGILGIGGAIAMVIGSLILVDAPQPELRITLMTALGIVIPFALIFMFLAGLAIKASCRRVETGREGMIGLVGDCITDVDQEGKVFIRGEYWEAYADYTIPKGFKVRVLEVDHLKIKVKKEE